MHNILISGYYGFGNIGDEAILDTMLRRIRIAVPDAQITVLSASPERTRELYNVKTVARAHPLKLLSAVWRCDTLISGGGSLIQDVTGKLSILYYLAIIEVASWFGKRIMIYSQGIGPIIKPLNRKLTCHVLNHVDVITVREENSKNDLMDMGVRPERLYVTADPVIDMQIADQSLGLHVMKESGIDLEKHCRRVAFALRSKDFKSEAAYASLVRVVENLLALEREVVFLPFHYTEDLHIMERLRQDFGSRIHTLIARHNMYEMLSLISQMDLLVGVRLHALIFSAVARTPIVALSYDPKIDYFMNAIQQQTFCSVDNFDPEALTAEIESRLGETEKERAALNDAVQVLRAKLDLNELELVKLMERKRGA
jgi:polysaccharide pyruvyl transferase CsaB